ncbi:hypothetical protein [Epilithonimonas sp. UC225_85]|uniref:hypothetical protein n=1 Tax=Epilithonimonas sp. UC225_85 TaxID=3350167 RepID=UPI0036D409C9
MKISNTFKVIICFSIVLIGCTKKYSTLIIELKNQKKSSGIFAELNKLVVKKDNKIFKTFLPKDINPYLGNPLKIDSLEKGIYQFEYDDLFGRKQIKIYVAKNRKEVDTLIINPDYIDTSKQIENSIIKKLKDNQIIFNFESKGCFHMTSDSIIVQNKNNKFFLINKGKTKELNQEEIDILIQFESELYSIPQEKSCTTTEFYKIKFKNKTQEFINGNCSWNGWYNLKEDLKIKD